jgi:hypothetical protein
MIAHIGITIDTPWTMLFAMIIMHAIADFPLQGAFLAQGKNRHLAHSEFQGEEPRALWFYCLSAHSLIQAGGVWLVTGNAMIAAVEFIVHWALDYAKCEGWTNFHVDQLAHVLCKIGYVVYLSSLVS